MSSQLWNPRTPPHDRAIGIEVECLLPREKYLELQTYEGFFLVSSDGSINETYDNRGVEFVSQPLTEQWLKKEIYKLYSKFPWTYNDSCGIHVHVSKKWCSVKRAKAIAKFLSSLSDLDMEYLFGRQPNQYCRNIVSTGRYVAVNTSNRATIEFRMFSSGDAMWAAYCVSMAAYLVKNAHHLNYDAMSAFRDYHMAG